MSRLRKSWVWLGNSKNQKTLTFVGGGLTIVAGACWQIYPHLFSTEEHKLSAAQQITATQGGIAASGNVNITASSGGTAIIQTGTGSIHITNTQGISEEKFQRLAEELGVRKQALEKFFEILEQAQVASGDLDHTLREIAKRYKDLQTKLDSFSPDDPEVATLKRQAKEALDAGNFERAEKLLNQASEQDIRAANELQAIAKKRLLSAAAAKAANGALKYTQLAYVEAAAYYRQAAELVPADEESTSATYLLFQGMNLGTAGQYPEAVQALERSLSLREKALGSDHPDNALNLILLATLYSAQDKLVEIEPLYLRALAIQEKALGPDHPNVALSLNSLGVLYRNRGQYAKAEPPLQRALTILEKSAESNPEAMFQNLLYLGQLYHTQGRYAEAEPLLQRALDTAGQVFGPDHPFVAAASGFLGGLYSSQGRHAEAEVLRQRALAINEKVFGPNSPNTAESLANLALAYQARGDHAKAEPLLKRALPILEQTFGPNHPQVAVALNNLAALYLDQDRDAEAEPLLKRALMIVEKAFGPDHPDVAGIMANLAELYGDLSRYADAEPLFRRALMIGEKALGPDHPKVATILEDYAALLKRMNRTAEAESLETRAKAIRAKQERDKLATKTSVR